MKIAVAGFGLEGRSSYDYYRKLGHEVTILDQDPYIELPEDTHAIHGPSAFKDLDRFDLIIRSSGINPNKLIDDNPGIESKVTSQLNEFLKVCPSKKIIGVTGTKGKGTTASLITKILKADGKNVCLGGNIGIPMLDLLDKINEDSYVVLELSSFQLCDLAQPSPSIAVCLMLAPEHLDWHGSLENYIAAKSNLFTHQSESDTAIFMSGNELSELIASKSPGRKLPYFKPPGAFVENEEVMIGGQIICKTTDLKLLGSHNWQNVCAAVTACWQFTHNIEAMRSAITSFSGLPHRLEFIKQVNDVRYYNDSFASQPKATEAAIAAIPGPQVVIVGGFDRMLDLHEFSEFVKIHQYNIRTVLVIGACSSRLIGVFKEVDFNNYVDGSSLTDMKQIVSKATDLSQPGDAVVLSPGFASFDMFKNFEDRGNQFKEAVESL
ncbi:MAG TPA: UDP-N-acetylmuramoyl-L-alanine--D-glutamate ligase [Candidatus Saccharimonadales bacterium]|nr:UDP-N-acetylmuramoyl-L-alanine--D-glutamate ligase [Candidatus Saccharimonadales bacterium]